MRFYCKHITLFGLILLTACASQNKSKSPQYSAHTLDRSYKVLTVENSVDAKNTNAAVAYQSNFKAILDKITRDKNHIPETFEQPAQNVAQNNIIGTNIDQAKPVPKATMQPIKAMLKTIGVHKKNENEKPTQIASLGPIKDILSNNQNDGILAGRTIDVYSISDLYLNDKEVILTFDDGPRPGKTDKILNTLQDHNVKATFFMVGSVAKTYPDLVQEIAKQGHTIASHTESHPDLTKLSMSSAVKEINAGHYSVSKALGETPSNFFRFPYLADSADLRRLVGNIGLIDVAPDIDSKDYFKSSPSEVLNRTMTRLRKKGKGIILFHDIHMRTALMMPDFLKALKKEGYKIVHIKSPDTTSTDPSPII